MRWLSQRKRLRQQHEEKWPVAGGQQQVKTKGSDHWHLALTDHRPPTTFIMVTFRREKRKRRMHESKVSEEARADKPGSSSNDEIRVTDRRRFNFDSEMSDEAASGGDASVEAPRLNPTYVEQLEAQTLEAEQKVADVQSRFEQLRGQLQRETAETRARLNRAADERARHEKAEFITTLLPVGDNLRRAIEAAEQGGGLEALLDGVRGTLNNFESALTALGVETLASVGEQFDPELHEAVDTVAVKPERDGAVTAEYSRGYKMNDRLLRPARVQVGRAQAEREAKKAAE
jgi:molecular chaperone GrpE